MGKYRQLILKMKDQRGATAIMIGLMMVMFVSFAALSVDIGYLMVTENELQNTADAAALAATRQLGSIYESMSYTEQLSYVCDPSTIIPTAQQVGENNSAAGRRITINSGDVVIGTWDNDSRSLAPGLDHPNAVQVTARRDSIANGAVATFFARIFGTDTVGVSADATAALTGASSSPPGGLDLPIGISKYWFTIKTEPCGEEIQFNPTGTLEGCAGWNTFDSWPANNNKLRTILNGMLNGTFESPGVTVNQTEFAFIGGNLGEQAFNALLALYNAKKDENGEWKTYVVVYDRDDCSNPNQMVPIVGFATAIITEVLPPPDMTITARVYCSLVESGRGGGGYYGTMGAIPNLVE